MNPIRKRSNEMYIIRRTYDKYEEIRTDRCSTLWVHGKVMERGERIRFVEINANGRRTGREIFAEIEHVYGDGRHGKRLIKYRKVSELRHVFSKVKAREAKRKKVERA